MVASSDTIGRVASKLIEVLGPRLAVHTVNELRSIPGNKSFKDTISRLHVALIARCEKAQS